MIKFSVTRKGRPLSKSLYTWDKHTRTFSTTESNLVLDFKGTHKVTFTTGSHCSFTTGYGCTFTTGPYCMFNTGYGCTFTTGPYCMFNTGANCKFNTGFGCIFNTEYSCIFKTENNCIVIKKHTLEVIRLEKDFNHIKLNGFGIPGYKEMQPNHTIIMDGKEIQISHETYENMKNMFF